MRIFGLVIKKEREYDALERQISRMADRQKDLDKENAVLMERLMQYESGKRCTGGYCDRCEHSVLGTSIDTRLSSGYLYTTETHLCDLDIPCPDFAKKEKNT